MKNVIRRKKRSPRAMRFTKDALKKIKNTVGYFPAESGGMLLGHVNQGLVTEFVFDEGKNQRRTGVAYDPDNDFLNAELDKGRAKGLELVGFIHSHPRGCSKLSGDYGNVGDVGYLKTIFKAMPELDYLFTPIVFSTADGKPFEIFSYAAEPGLEANYKLIPLFCDEKLLASSSSYQYQEPNKSYKKVQSSNLKIDSFVLMQIENNLSKLPIHSGGLLLGDVRKNSVNVFVFDAGLTPSNGLEYIPDSELYRRYVGLSALSDLGFIMTNNGPMPPHQLKQSTALSTYLKNRDDGMDFICCILDKHQTEVIQIFNVLPNNGAPIITALADFYKSDVIVQSALRNEQINPIDTRV